MDTEEFEFRPITEGLGFHRKSNPLKADKNKTESQVLDSIKSPIQQAASLSAQLGLDVEATVEAPAPKKAIWGEPVVRKPLPRAGDERNKTSPVHSTMAVSSAVARAASALSGNAPALPMQAPLRNPTSHPATAAGIEAIVKANAPTSAFCWSAAIVDAVMVFATSLIFLVCLLLITNVDLMNLLAQSDINPMTYVSLFVLLVAVAQIYMVGCRGWAGATLGDWAFDIEVGNYLEKSSLVYPLKLFTRSLLYTATGFLVIPILTTVLNRDLAGQITGLTLQSRR